MGSRLRPFTHTVPKVLLQVADKPILGHILDKLIAIGVHHVTFVVGYLGDHIETYVQKYYPNLETAFVEQAEPRGLGHAIHLTAPTHRDCDEPILIILGDTIIEADLSLLSQADTDLIGVCEVENPHRFGIVELDGDRISAMVEKPETPPSNLAIVGIYYMRQPAQLYEALDANIREGRLTRGEIQLTDALQRMIETGTPMRAFQVSGWHDCGKPESLLNTNHALLQERFQTLSMDMLKRYPSVRFRPPVFVAPTARLGESIIGPNVTIADGARVTQSIVQNSIINQGAQVENVILSNSIIGNDALVREKALRLYVGDKSEVLFD
jgi:glucose-1-phosphate thymidylyltransferase